MANTETWVKDPNKALLITPAEKGLVGRVVTSDTFMARSLMTEQESRELLETKAVASMMTDFKKCSRCKKLGRTHMHPVHQFSRLKSGRLHSQCKACRVEQTVKWDKEQGERRKEYQKEYQKTRKPANRRAKGRENKMMHTTLIVCASCEDSV